MDIFEKISSRHTPRAIISYINEIVRLRKQEQVWLQDETHEYKKSDVKYLGLFVLLKSRLNALKSNNVLTALLTKSYADEHKLFIDAHFDDKLLFSNMAALTYNTTPKLTRETVLLPHLRDTLLGKSSTSLSLDLSSPENHHYLELIIDELIEDEDNIDKVITALNEVSSADKYHIWKELYHLKINIHRESFDDLSIDKILIGNLIDIERREYAQYLMSSLTEKYTGNQSGEDFIKTSEPLLELLYQFMGEGIYDIQPLISVTPEFVVKYFVAVKRMQVCLLWKNFEVSHSDLTTYLKSEYKGIPKPVTRQLINLFDLVELEEYAKSNGLKF